MYDMTVISEQYLLDMRAAVRNRHTKHDDEIRDLIVAARFDLCTLGGIKVEKVADEGDPLIKDAIKAFVRGKYGLDNPDAEKYLAAYSAMRDKLMLSDDYRKEADDKCTGTV